MTLKKRGALTLATTDSGAVDLGPLVSLASTTPGPIQQSLAILTLLPIEALTPEEAIVADLTEARKNDMRGKEHVVADLRMMADMIAAPQHDVVAERNEGLHDVVLEDEAVLAEPDVAPHEGARLT